MHNSKYRLCKYLLNYSFRVTIVLHKKMDSICPWQGKELLKSSKNRSLEIKMLRDQNHDHEDSKKIWHKHSKIVKKEYYITFL